MANAANLINFGSGGLAIGDVTYSAYTLNAPAYLPMVDQTLSYLVSSYPTLGALYTTPATAFATSTLATSFTSPPYMNEMAYGNGMFVAIDTASTTAFLNYRTSPDGVTWTLRSLFPTLNGGVFAMAPLRGISFGNGVFVITATGANATNTGTQVFTSQDGLNWTKVELNPSGALSSWPILIGNVWLAYNTAGSGLFYRSSDNGVTWNGYMANTFTSMGAGRAYGNGIAVSGGHGSTVGLTGISYSIDQGGNWSLVSTPAGYFGSIAFGNGIFVAIDNYNSTNLAISSTNGSTWTARTLPSTGNWSRVVFGNGVFLAVSSTGTQAATSVDGITWTARTLPVSGVTVQALAYGGPTNAKFFLGLPYNSATGYRIDYSVTQTTFNLPYMTTTVQKNMLPYIKAS